MSCSRLFIKGYIIPKSCFYVKPALPFRVELEYKYLAFHNPSKPPFNFTKIKSVDCKTEEDCISLIEKINEGYCFECGNIKNCNK